MAARKLAANVLLQHDGEVVALGPDDDVPAWAADLIGDHCYEDAADGDGKRAAARSRKAES